MNHTMPLERPYSIMNFSLQLRFFEENGETWVAVPDATHILGYPNNSAFLGSYSNKIVAVLDGEDVTMVPFNYFARAAITSDKPQARAVGDRMLEYLAAGLKITVIDAPTIAAINSAPKASTKYGPQPILDIMRQRGISRQRAIREMNAIQLDDVPRLATTAEGQLMGSMPVQDVTVARASAWLKMPLPQLFNSWRRADQRFLGLATILSDDVLAQYVVPA